MGNVLCEQDIKYQKLELWVHIQTNYIFRIWQQTSLLLSQIHHASLVSKQISSNCRTFQPLIEITEANWQYQLTQKHHLKRCMVLAALWSSYHGHWHLIDFYIKYFILQVIFEIFLAFTTSTSIFSNLTFLSNTLELQIFLNIPTQCDLK